MSILTILNHWKNINLSSDLNTTVSVLSDDRTAESDDDIQDCAQRVV